MSVCDSHTVQLNNACGAAAGDALGKPTDMDNPVSDSSILGTENVL
jgi:hypothetical protein